MKALIHIASIGLLTAAMSCPAVADSWRLESSEIDPQRYFGVTVANGAIGVLSSSTPLTTQRTLIAGAYETNAPGRISTILRTFDLLNLSLEIDGERIDQLSQVRNFRQQLSLREAVFSSSFDYGDKASVVYSMRALRQLPYVALLEVRVTARKSVSVVATTAVTAPPLMKDVQSFDLIFPPQKGYDGAISMVAASGRGPSGRLVAAASQGFIFNESGKTAPEVTRSAAGVSFAKQINAGSTYEFAVVGSTLTSAQVQDPLNASKRMTMFAAIQGTARLTSQHDRAWAELWKGSIAIEGDEVAQRDVNSMLYHLYSFARAGSKLSVPPMGLSSEGYNGHVFWDAELWMFPVLLVLQPRMAESMLDYRYERLPAARRNAAAFGYRGAMFPWESAESGEDDTPLPAISGVLQHHVTADVGIAAWNYYRVTQDKTWLREKGYPLIKETADFWTSRVSRNGPGRYDINNVMAADEYAYNVDNNAFTNAAARENLAAAIAASRILGLVPDPDWAQVRENIPILKFPDGTTREHARYDGAEIKQADVNLLAYPLKAVTEKEAIRRDLEYYAQRVSARGPAMTHAIFSILHSRLGEPDRAFAMFNESFKSRQCPPFGVIAESLRSDNPYFATGAGGALQSVLFGFGGLEVTDKGLVQLPSRLPAAWRSLTLSGVGPQKRTYTVTFK